MIDVIARDAAVARGDDRDLSNEAPAGLPLAHQRLVALVDEVRTRWPDRPLFLGGFSQGRFFRWTWCCDGDHHWQVDPAVLRAGDRAPVAVPDG